MLKNVEFFENVDYSRLKLMINPDSDCVCLFVCCLVARGERETGAATGNNSGESVQCTPH